MNRRFKYQLFTGLIQRAFACVYVPPRQFKKIQNIVDPRAKLTHPEFEAPSLLLKLKHWPSSIVLTSNREFLRHTSVRHLKDVNKLLREIGEDYKE